MCTCSPIKDAFGADQKIELCVQRLAFLCHILSSDSMTDCSMDFDAAVGLVAILESIVTDLADVRAWAGGCCANEVPLARTRLTS